MPPIPIPANLSRRTPWLMVSKATERSMSINRVTLPLSLPAKVIVHGDQGSLNAETQPETRLKWIQKICFIQQRLELPGHNTLQHFAQIREVCHWLVNHQPWVQVRLFKEWSNYRLFQGGRDHSLSQRGFTASWTQVRTPLADLLISQDGQGSSGVVVERTDPSTLSTSSGLNN